VDKRRGRAFRAIFEIIGNCGAEVVEVGVIFHEAPHGHVEGLLGWRSGDRGMSRSRLDDS
jgi:hypothetical protein